MVCIWEGYINKVWDSIQFCRILQNTFSWAENILRPKVSYYIDQWKSRRSSPEEEKSEKSEKLGATCDPVAAPETPIEERKLSELSLRDLIQHLERLGLALAQCPQCTEHTSISQPSRYVIYYISKLIHIKPDVVSRYRTHICSSQSKY